VLSWGVASGPDPEATQKFDAYARDYQALHARSVGASGEEPTYFFEYKRRCIERLAASGESVEPVEPILDYGCGIGMLMQQLRQRFPRVDGFDPSKESVALAAARVPGATLFAHPAEIPDDRYGMAVLSCVLHHVPPPARAELVARVASKLRPGGRLVVFEHNPWNPLTRRAVALCPFDDDAILLRPREARGLLEGAGLADIRLDYIVFLPKALAPLRFLEPRLRAVPLGAQVMVVGTRPSSRAGRFTSSPTT
jgi:SAM-dependent methyltransferase